MTQLIGLFVGGAGVILSFFWEGLNTSECKPQFFAAVHLFYLRK